MRKRLGFTLLELLIVMVIMGILLGMTMHFGSDRVKDLDRQSVSDQFVDNFQNFIGQSRTSSYLYGQKYTELVIHILSGAHGVSLSLSGTTLASVSGFTSSNLMIDRIIAGNASVSSIDVMLSPYALGCQISSATNVYSGFTLLSTISNQKYCYWLVSDVCALKKIPCK